MLQSTESTQIQPDILTRLNQKAQILRLHVVNMIGVDHVGHLGGSCSIADVVAALYFHIMRINPQQPKDPDRDRFLLSKGHAALIQYAALAEAGFFPMDELKTVKRLGSNLQGHPDMLKTPGIEANTGSLGQGLSVANGLALGMRLDQSPRRVYVVVGDGEQAEGQIWEAAMASAYYKLDNLTAILDRNRLQATGPVDERFKIGNLNEKWTAFGWNVLEIDGHDMAQILQAFAQAETVKGKPTLIIANTVKGKGVSFAENVVSFHNGAMTQAQFDTAVAELEAKVGC